MVDFKHTQEEELHSWLIEDKDIRHEKAQRETVRYPLIAKQMGLTALDTSQMTVWDIGCGPLGGVSTVVNAKHIVRIDPLGIDYAECYPQIHMLAIKAEDLKEKLSQPDLIIVTNALDHFEKPTQFLDDLAKYMKYGAYFASLHAINNAYTHPHEAHQQNINKEIIYEHLYDAFEFVWELDFKNDGLTYGWRKQPAYASLARKIK